MNRVKISVSGATAVVAMVLAGLGGPASAATAARDIPAPQVKIKHVGDLQQYGSAAVTVSVRCFDGALAEQLAVTITQGEVSGGRSDTRDDIVCDGVRRDVPVFPYSDDGADFTAGPAMVTARLTVVDPRTLAALPEVVATHRVYLRPFVSVTVAKGPVRLNANGSALVRASVKCQPPYQISGFYVSISQNGGRIVGHGATDAENPLCDGTWHEREFTATPNKPFVTGKTRVTAMAYVLDVDTYDPVDWVSIDRKRQAVRSGS
ncbi:MAG: hypothetical protein L0H78_18025 [Humibacillus sp.]|nr:hypothetical protein [Humibacillus sp.]